MEDQQGHSNNCKLPLPPVAPLSKNVASDNATQNLNAWKGPLVLLPSYPVDEDMEDNSCRLATMRMAASGAGGQFLDLVVTSSHLHSLKDLLIMTIYTKSWAMVLVSRDLQERVM